MKRKVVKQLKKFLCRGMATLFLILPCMPVGVYADEITSSSTLTTAYSIEELLEMDDSACLIALLQEGLVLPEVYTENMEYTAGLVKRLLVDIQSGYATPDALPYNYTELAELSKRIYALVQSSLPDASTCASTYSTYTLQQSTPIGSWSDSYMNYNCYAYAIRRTTSDINPGSLSGRSYNIEMSIETISSIICSDLNSLGYSSYRSTSKPSSIESNQYVICVRKSLDDYHLMRGNTACTTWQHKPGHTQPLKWNYTTPGYAKWIREYYRKGVAYEGTPKTDPYKYQGTIYYIVYWKGASA